MYKILLSLILITSINYTKGQLPIANKLYSVGDTLTDIDGNKYPTVIILGKQWMAENLRVTRLNDGTAVEVLLEGKKYGIWEHAGEVQTPAYCWYKGKKDVEERTDRGALYNWFVVETKNVCPLGWHVTTVDEWDMIEKLADPTFIPTKEVLESNKTGKKLRSQSGWKEGFLFNGPGDDKFGLAIKPGGSKRSYNKFSSGIDNDAIFWTSRDEHLATTLELQTQDSKGIGINFLDKAANALNTTANALDAAANAVDKTSGKSSVEQPKEKSSTAVTQKVGRSISNDNDNKADCYSIRCVKD